MRDFYFSYPTRIYFMDDALTKAKKELGWQAELSIEDMCLDAYHYIEQANKRAD